MFNNYRHRAPPSPCSGSRGGAGAGAYAPSSEDGSPKSDFQKIKKDPRGRRWCPPPRHTKFQDFIYNISLCPRGRRGTPGSIWRGAPGSPKPSCLFSHFICSDNIALQAPTATAAAAAAPLPCSPGGWLGHPSVHGAPRTRPHPPSVVVRLLLLRLTKPLEKSRDRF